MTGDTYEMEDQRNWTDASYKTYIRPLAEPWPYELSQGTQREQSVTVEITIPASVGGGTGDAPISVSRNADGAPCCGSQTAGMVVTGS